MTTMRTRIYAYTHECENGVNGLREHLSRPPQPYHTPKDGKEKVAPKRKGKNSPEFQF